MAKLIRDTYQDCLLPDGTEKGFKDTLRTWENIKDDFKDKVVLDIGCNQGYFMVQCLIAGAKLAIGIDLNGTHWCAPLDTHCMKPLDVAQRTFDLWQFKNTELIEGNWEDVNVNKKVDVILCLSTAHYFKNILQGIRKIFAMDAELLIFESAPKEHAPIKNLAKEYNYTIIEEKPSHWNSYTIFKIKR